MLTQRRLDSLGLPIAYVDPSQRYRFANAAFIEAVGRSSDQVIGYRVADVIGNDIHQLFHAYLEAALAGERTSYERQLAPPGREPIWIHVDYFPDRGTDGKIQGVFVAYADVDDLIRDVGFKPETSIEEGVGKFVEWYRGYYRC